MVFKSFSFDLGNSRKNTNYIIFRSKITEFRSKSPKFRSEFIGISFFEFEVPFRSELANFDEISAEISFPANGGIRKKNEKVNPARESPVQAGWESLRLLLLVEKLALQWGRYCPSPATAGGRRNYKRCSYPPASGHYCQQRKSEEESYLWLVTKEKEEMACFFFK